MIALARERAVRSSASMRFIVACAALCALVLCSFSQGNAQDIGSQTCPHWWSNLDHNDQVIAIEAGIDAYIAGWVDGARSTKASARRESLLSGREAPLLSEVSHTFGFYASAVSDFYALHPKAHNADVGDILGCLADNPVDPCSELAKFYETR